MAHLKHATVMGINEAAVRGGILAWDTEKRAAVACLRVANRLTGPEGVDSVSAKTASLIYGELRKEYNAAVRNGMKVAANGVTAKTASARNLEDTAIKVAEFCVRVKLAEADGSLTNNEPNTPESAGMTNAVADLDNQNRAPGEYLVGVGNTDMMGGGVVGDEMPHPDQQQRTDMTPNSVTEHSKISSQLRARGLNAQKLAKLARTGNAAQRKHASLLLGALQKEAQQNSVQNAINAVLGKTAEDDGGVGGLFDPSGANMPPAAGMDDGGASSDDIVSALMDAGIDPDEVSPDDVLKALDSGGGDDEPAEKEEKSDDEKKEAAWLRSLFKTAEGGSLTNSPPNTAESAAATDSIAALDNKNRKPGEYLTGQGGTSAVGSNGEGQQYDVQSAPKAPSENPSNTVSDETKSAEEREHLAYVRKIAQQYGSRLPAAMPRNTKIAHVKNLAGLSPAHREKYLANLKR